MTIDTRKLIESGYSQDKYGHWTLGTIAGGETLVTNAYDGGTIIASSGTYKSRANSYDFAGSMTILAEINRGIALFEQGAIFSYPKTSQEVAAFHAQELSIQIGERMQDQKKAYKNLDSEVTARLNLQIAFNKTNKTSPINYANATLALANAAKVETNANLSALQATSNLLSTKQMYIKGRVFWPNSAADASSAQKEIDEYEKQINAVNSQISDFQKNLAAINKNILDVKNGINSIKSGKVPERFKFTPTQAQLEEAVKTVSDFYSKVYGKLGEKASTNAQTLAAASKGKRIRNYNDAMAAWNKYGNNIEKKLSLADRNAVVNALNSMTQTDLAKNYQKFSKAFGVTSKALDLHRLYQNIKTAVKTGIWAPVITNIESLLAGALVAELAAIIFGGLVIGAVTAAMFAILGMLLASYVDVDHMKSLNDWFATK